MLYCRWLLPLWLFQYGSRLVRVLFLFTSLNLCIVGAGALCSSWEHDCGQEPLELLSQICSSLERFCSFLVSYLPVG